MRLARVRWMGFALVLLSLVCLQADEQQLYVGTYTGGDSQGIYLLGLNSETGELKHHGLAAETENPSFLALHPNGRYLFAVNETDTGQITSFAIDPKTHRLRKINQQPSGGGAPCHLVVDRGGKHLLVANYSGGSVSVTRINDDGSLGQQTSHVQHEGKSVDPRRQTKPHAHSINLDVENRFAVVADLGTDELVVYRFDAKNGVLERSSATKLAAGAGPRHFAFHPNGRAAFAINELDSTVTALAYDPVAGKLVTRQSLSTLPRDFSGRSHTAEVRVSKDGRFVYGSNRGHDSIAVYRIEENGQLSLIQIQAMGGKTPRNFNLSPDGRFLLAAGQASHDIHVFRVDAHSGKLLPTEHVASVPQPVCLRFIH